MPLVSSYRAGAGPGHPWDLCASSLAYRSQSHLKTACAIQLFCTAWACRLVLSHGEYGRNTSLIFEVHRRWHLPDAPLLFCFLIEEERLERNATSDGADAAGAASWRGPSGVVVTVQSTTTFARPCGYSLPLTIALP